MVWRLLPAVHLPPASREFRASAAVERERAAWCAWQESNLLPLAPQASALSGELQAHGRKAQFRRGSIAAVAALNVVRSRLLTTTRATNTERCQHANRTEGRS